MKLFIILFSVIIFFGCAQNNQIKNSGKKTPKFGTIFKFRIDQADQIYTLAGNKKGHPLFKVVFKRAKQIRSKNDSDFLSAFVQAWDENDQELPMARIFANQEFLELNKNSSNLETIQTLKQMSELFIEKTKIVLTKRVENIGYTSEILTNSKQKGEFDLKIYGDSFPDKTLKILLARAELGFWEVDTVQQIVERLRVDPANRFASKMVKVDRDFIQFNQADTAIVNSCLNSYQFNNILLSWEEHTSETDMLLLRALKTPQFMSGSGIVDAISQPAKFDHSQVILLKMNSESALKWENLTEKLSQNYGLVAITINNNIVSCPRVYERISGGMSQLTSNFSKEKADELAMVLKSGQLPSKVHFISVKTFADER